MERIDDDCLLLAFRHLPPKSLGAAACTCRRWRKVAQDDSLWESVCRSLWPAVAAFAANAAENAKSCERQDSCNASANGEQISASPQGQAHAFRFRDLVYRRLTLPSLATRPTTLAMEQLSIAIDLTLQGKRVLSMCLGSADLRLNETADDEDFDFFVRRFPCDAALPYCPLRDARMRQKDRPSTMAKQLLVRVDLIRRSDAKMLRLLGSPPVYQADDLRTLVFCETLPALPFGTGLLMEVDLEYRIIPHEGCPPGAVWRNTAASGLVDGGSPEVARKVAMEVEEETSEEGEEFVKWEFRLCRLNLKRSASFAMATCDEFMRYLSHFMWT